MNHELLCVSGASCERVCVCLCVAPACRRLLSRVLPYCAGAQSEPLAVLRLFYLLISASTTAVGGGGGGGGAGLAEDRPSSEKGSATCRHAATPPWMPRLPSHRSATACGGEAAAARGGSYCCTLLYCVVA